MASSIHVGPGISGECLRNHTVKTTSYTPVVQDSQDVPEDFLLDVGVSLFDPGIDEFLGMMKTPRTPKSVLRNPAMRRIC